MGYFMVEKLIFMKATMGLYVREKEVLEQNSSPMIKRQWPYPGRSKLQICGCRTGENLTVTEMELSRL